MILPDLPEWIMAGAEVITTIVAVIGLVVGLRRRYIKRNSVYPQDRDGYPQDNPQ